jgi:chemotaxis protein methyltransferase CheR
MTPRVVIVASDLDSEVLAAGKRAVYPLAAVEKLPKEMLARYFLRGVNAQSGYVRVRPEIRALVTFRQQNLLDRVWDVDKPFDVIFCRNVLIYFSKETQNRVLEHLRSSLVPEGLLFTGKAESLMHDTGLFRSLGRCVYRRVPDPVVRE